jgi:hypothetical protein
MGTPYLPQQTDNYLSVDLMIQTEKNSKSPIRGQSKLFVKIRELVSGAGMR